MPPSTPEFEAQHEPPGRPYLRQLSLQLAAAFIVLCLAWPYFLIRNEALPWPHTAFVIGAVALLMASATRQTWWWRLIHALFAPAAATVAALGIAPGWFLLAFMLLLVYRGALTGQIPLYLSNRTVAAAIAKLVDEQGGRRFVDLGAGIGSIVATLARERPELRVAGVENAPATWLVGYLRTRSLSNCDWQWGDFWKTDLGHYDVVYAFLSPAPMAALATKIEREMKPGALFISNSFALPGRDADRIVEIDDARATRLYCYRGAPEG